MLPDLIKTKFGFQTEDRKDVLIAILKDTPELKNEMGYTFKLEYNRYNSAWQMSVYFRRLYHD
jgi:hypothetical protein